MQFSSGTRLLTNCHYRMSIVDAKYSQISAKEELHRYITDFRLRHGSTTPDSVRDGGQALMMLSLSPVLFTSISNTMRYQKVFAEEVFGEIVKLDVVCSKPICCRDPADTSQLVHVY